MGFYPMETSAKFNQFKFQYCLHSDGKIATDMKLTRNTKRIITELNKLLELEWENGKTSTIHHLLHHIELSNDEKEKNRNLNLFIAKGK